MRKKQQQAPQPIKIKLKNCPMCGKAFIAMPGHRVCRDCREKEYQMERDIINYVRDHPGAQPDEIIEETGADGALLKRMIEEGRFVEMGQTVMHPCRKCGKMISVGRYCKACYVKMKTSLQQVQTNIKAKKAKKDKEREERTYSKSMKEQIDGG